MATKEELMLKKADYVLVVNKDFEIVYNSRFDSNMGGAQDSKEYKHFFFSEIDLSIFEEE